MCKCVPLFDDFEHLGDDFYGALINSSICGPLQAAAETVYIEGGNKERGSYYMAKISRADMEDYTKLLFGINLPAYEPSFQKMEADEGNFYYADGFYYIGWFDPMDIIYTYVGCEILESGNVAVEIAMSGPFDGKADIFELAPANNENGFVIVSRKNKDL